MRRSYTTVNKKVELLILINKYIYEAISIVLAVRSINGLSYRNEWMNEWMNEWITRKPITNAKLSARQPWYIGRNSLNRPSRRNAQQYQRNLYVVEKYFQCATILSLTMRVYLHLFSSCCLPNTRSSAKFRENFNLAHSSSRSPNVDDFGANRKRLCDFLLVINSNFGSILHRFWDTAAYWLKLRIFPTPLLLFGAPRSLCFLFPWVRKRGTLISCANFECLHFTR